MTEYKWWHTGIIYQIYPRSFFDTNDDGIGDIQGIISNLNYLTSLGISAVWLSPHYPSPMEDFGYDVSDYKDVHPIFGTLTDFDELVLEAHKRDIKIIIDFVPNHSSDKHEWFIESSSNRNNQKSDYYVWKEGKENRTPPNNWICVIGGSAWTWNETRKQYYLHSFHSGLPDLNWHNNHLRKTMLEVLAFWLDRGVDGFRITMPNWIAKDKQFRNDPLNPDFNPETDLPYQKLKHIYSLDAPEVFTYLKQINKIIKENDKDKVSMAMVDEAWFYPSDALPDYFTTGKVLDFPTNFGLFFLSISGWKAAMIKNYIDLYDKMQGEHGNPNYYLGSHDHPRIASRLDPHQARIAAMLMLTLRGIPFLYYADELGLINAKIPLSKRKDLWSDRSRDSYRTPMQWNSKENSGFSISDPWLPVVPNYKNINIESLKLQPTSILNLYHKLLKLRKNYPALTIGSYISESNIQGNCFVFRRTYKEQNLLISLNFGSDPCEIVFSNMKGRKIIISTFLDREETIEGVTLRLRENEGCIIEL